MNIVNKLTLRHLKENKRRTLVTIIGVIISVAMITAVATLGVSFIDLMRRQEIANNGEWHVTYKNVNLDQLQAIKSDDATEVLIISKDAGYAYLEGSQNDNKPYLFIKEYNTHGMETFPIELSAGRMPRTENEVLISEEIIENAKVGYQLGEVLTLDVGDRFSEGVLSALDQTTSLMKDEKGKLQEELVNSDTRYFTIVGKMKRPTWEPTWSPGYTMITYVDESLIGVDDTVNATVQLKKVNDSLFDHTERLAEENKIEAFQYNDALLRYYGVIKNERMRTTLFSLSAIIMIIIMIGSISLIYNAFAISVSERSRHLGMLSSVGATKKQKQNSVFFEGFIIGLISIPIGIVGGLVGIGITFYFINAIIQGALGVTEKLTVTVTILSIVVAILVPIVTIFISTFIPAKRASRISAIDAIRQTADVKLTSKAVKTSKLVRKLFGIEAEIGLKNLKRNKRRYQATVFSLIISIVLFLAVSFFTDSLKKSLLLSQDGVNFDIMVQLGNEEDEKLTKEILSLEGITKYNLMKEWYLNSWIDEEAMADELLIDGVEDGKFPYTIILHVLDDRSLQTYAHEIGADYGQLQNGLNSIVIDTISYQNLDKGMYVETKAIHTKIGQTIDLYYPDSEIDQDSFLSQVTVTALTDQLPMGVHPAGLGGLNLVVSEHVLEQLADDSMKHQIQSFLYLNSQDPMKTQQKIEEMEENKHFIYNYYQNRQREQQMVMLMSVFSYGFIALITLISIANIFNTISTSIALRKREFAMLKSVGMTPKGFNKMINYESIFYGIKSLLYGLPISIVTMYLMYLALGNSFEYQFTLPWSSLLYVVVAVFLIVSLAMLYSSSKVKKENIIDALKQENM